MPHNTDTTRTPCEDDWRLGVDIGGTFTDFQLMNTRSGEVVALKTPSTPDDPSLAVARGLEDITRRHGIDPSAIRYFAHGTTLAVNTLLERKGACTGVLMTRGFTDTLELRRLRLSKANDFFVPRPVPLVPRRLVRPVDERLKSDGEVITPLRREDVEEQVRALLEEGVETIAVCFLHAYRNPHHEQMARQWITESFPQVYVTASTDVWPQQREYERALVSVINAYVGGRMEAYFTTLEKRTRDLAMPCRVFSTKSNGGVMTAATAARRPVETLLSGPASGVIGARHVASSIGDDHVVTLDMGGTSVDVSIIQGAIGQATDNTIGDIPVIMPAVDVSAVGAGGGSIAWTDSEGVLKVGPRSAGARPGPACYGRGGTQPTVTDAYLVAGIIAEDSLLDGTMVLEPALADAAIDRLATVIDRTRSETADAILQVTTANIYAQLLPLTARRGIDTTGFSMLAYGAAGPTQAFMLARELDMRRIIVPPAPGTLCALGCLVADFRADFVQSVWRDLDTLSDQDLGDTYAGLETRARAWMEEQDAGVADVHVLRSADLCHIGQSYEINVPFPEVASLSTEDLNRWFLERYQKVYGYHDPHAPVRMLEARLQIVGVTPSPPVFSRPAGDGGRPRGVRRVHEAGDVVEAHVWRREDLRQGETYPGPLVIEQYDTTTWVPPGFVAAIDDFGNLIGERA
ncbi:MAG: hydantoinase/oxoprolinase family protein [bacterium]|nr:hydantoinase/oxoprolinase family protein [bacterium]